MAYFWPTALGFILQQGYAIVDSIVVGRFLGKGALAAIGGTNLTVLNLVIIMFGGLSTGPMVVISQQLGKGQKDQVSCTIKNSMLLSLVVGFVITALILPFAKSIHIWMKTPRDILSDSVTYIRWYLIGIVPMLVFNMGSSIFRAIGQANKPLVYLAVSTIVNLILDIVFVVILGLGIRGVAAASAIAQFVSAVMVVINLTKLKDGMNLKLDYRLSSYKMDKALVFKILHIGFPSAIQNALYFISGLLLSYCINLLGTDVVAAWSIFYKFDSLFWAISSAFNISVTNVSGMFYGAGDTLSLRCCASSGILCYMAVTFPFCAAMILTRGISPVLFSSDISVISEASKILLYMGLSYPTFMLTEILGSIMKGTGLTIKPTIITFITICLTRIVLVFAMALRHTTSFTIALCSFIPWTFSSLVFLVYYLSGKWMGKSLMGKNEH